MIDTFKIYPVNLFLMLFAGVIISCQPGKKPTLHIATAANARLALEEISLAFEKETAISTQIIVSSSGKHTAQIEAGAPYDIFISADLKYPSKLFTLGLTTAEPAIYAYGKLVIWTLDDSLSTGIENLATPQAVHIAIPNPKTAPYGQAAIEALKFYQLLDKLKPRLVYGESVGQTNQFIFSASAEIGFTAASIVMAPAMKNKGRWQKVDEKSYTPIAQGAVILKQSPQLDMANKFYLFLFSPTAKNILRSYGYDVKD
jgi:molybdate transport system substrate-binding protein